MTSASRRRVGCEVFTVAVREGESRTLEAIADDLQHHVQLAANQELIEPLSERELEVLVLIAGGLTNREIADQLYIGVSTVKKHINHIFSKLDVTHRAQAVAFARTLNLLQ